MIRNFHLCAATSLSTTLFKSALFLPYSKYPPEIWRLGRVDPQLALVSPASFQLALGDWNDLLEDFHWPEEHPVA